MADIIQPKNTLCAKGVSICFISISPSYRWFFFFHLTPLFQFIYTHLVVLFLASEESGICPRVRQSLNATSALSLLLQNGFHKSYYYWTHFFVFFFFNFVLLFYFLNLFVSCAFCFLLFAAVWMKDK